MINDHLETKCPRCGEGRLLGWNELNDEQRRLVSSLPGSLDYSQGERESTHRWCLNCLHEETENKPCNA
jgi:hypothetical protein